MKIRMREEHAAVIVFPSGRLDGIGAPELEAALCRAARRSGLVVLDGGGLDFVSSAGLRALLVGAKACVENGGKLAIAAFQPECRAILQVSGLLSVLDHHETWEAPLTAGSGPRRAAAKAAIAI